MRLLLIILFLGGGGYLAIQHYAEPEPLPVMEPLPPPPPPPPPPPRLTAKQYQQLRRRIFSTEPAVRSKVPSELLKYAGPEADELLQFQLRTDMDQGNRCRVIDVLRQRAEPTAAAIIAPSLNDTHPNVRMTAMLALRGLNAKEFRKEITQKLYDTDPSIKREAIITLRHFQLNIEKKIKKKTYRLPTQYQQAYNNALASAQIETAKRARQAPAPAPPAKP